MNLEKNVYLVKGIKNSAIYDLNSCVLYHLNNEAVSVLEKITNSSDYLLNDDELSFLVFLQSNKIVTENNIPKHSISELATTPKIDFVWIEITTGCNLKCVHCYDEASAHNAKTIEFSSFCHIIDELVENDIRKLQIIGGEPFILGAKLYQYLDYCLEKFDYLEIFTNGTLLTDNAITYIKNNNIKIALSVYSYDDKEHDKITKVKGSLSKTNSTIKKLYDNGIEYRVKNVIMSGLNQSVCNTSLYKLSPNHDIVRMVGRANPSLLNKELLLKKLITPKSFSKKIDKAYLSRMVSGHNCFSRRLYFSVDSQVYPCVMERRISHGNIQEKKLSDLIDERIRFFNKDKIKICNQCEFRYCCFDCRPDAFSNNVDSKPWYCTYDPFTGEWADPDDFAESILNSFK